MRLHRRLVGEAASWGGRACVPPAPATCQARLCPERPGVVGGCSEEEAGGPPPTASWWASVPTIRVQPHLVSGRVQTGSRGLSRPCFSNQPQGDPVPAAGLALPPPRRSEFLPGLSLQLTIELLLLVPTPGRVAVPMVPPGQRNALVGPLARATPSPRVLLATMAATHGGLGFPLRTRLSRRAEATLILFLNLPTRPQRHSCPGSTKGQCWVCVSECGSV